MTLKKEVFRIPFGKGADTKSTDIVLEPGQLEVLENAVIEKTGRLEKRKGCSSSTWGASGTDNPTGSFVYRKNLLVSGDKSLATLIGSDNEHTTIGYNNYLETELFHVTGGAHHHQESPSIALSHSGDYFAVAWTNAYWNDSTGAINYEYRISVVDAATGTIITPDIYVTQTTKTHRGSCKVVAHGASDAADDAFALYYEDLNSSALTLKKVKFSHDQLVANILGATSATTIADSSTYRQTVGEAFFDVYEHTPGAGNYQKVHVVFTEYTSATHKVTYKLDTNGTLSAAQSYNMGGAIQHITAYRSAAGGTARVYYAWSVSNVVHLRQQLESDSSTTQTNTNTETSGYKIIETGGFCDSEDGTKVNYFATLGTATSTFSSFVYRYIFTPGATTLDVDLTPFKGNCWTPIAPVKTAGGVNYFICQENRNTEDNDLSLHTVSAWVEPSDDTPILYYYYMGLVGVTFRQSLIRSHINGISCRVVSDGTSNWTALPRTTNLQTFVDTSGDPELAINSAIHLVKMTNTKPAYETSRAQIGGQLYISPGAIKATSSERLSELGFFYKPGISLTAQSAGNLDADGVYKYRACWEWEDSYGNLHRSEPSDEETLTLTGSDTGIVVKCDGLAISMKDWAGKLNLVVYRTQGGGNVLNKVATVSNPPLLDTITGTLLISHADIMSDANAATGAFLYTESGELANVAPPASRYIEAHRNRLFAISEDNRIWYSKEYENKVGIAFSDEFQIPIDGLDHDKPTALCSSGGDLIIFRERSTWSISGEGPSKLGVGEFYKPRQLSATIGALKGSATLFTDSGVYFQNIRGIFRFNKDGFEYVGAPVEGLVGSDRVVAIRHHQGTETIRFAFDDKVLSYNYRYEAWSNHTYSLGVGETIVGMENIDDTVYIVTSADKILKEDSSYKVGTNYIVLKLKTGWISFNGIQSFGRVYRFNLLGESRDKHTLTVKVYYDYDDSAAVDTYTFTTDSASDAKLEFRGHLSKQKCEAIKFEIYDADNSASTGDGFAIDHVALEIGMKKGTFRTTQANTTGAD